MLLTLAIIIYASIVCWTVGYAFQIALAKISKSSVEYRLSFPFTCLVGFIVLTIIAGYLSLFISISHLAIHLVIAGISLLILHRLGGYRHLRNELDSANRLSLPIKILGLSSLLLVLVLSSWEVYHPDSLGYHIQIIKWLNEFKVVPGIVHLNNRFALQSSWFVGCSVFSFSFAGLKTVTFLNSIILFWFIWFIIDGLHSLLQKKSYARYLLVTTLLIFVYWSFTQFRLTAMSPSPDFPTALVVWAVLYLFITKHNRHEPLKAVDTYLLILLTAFSITMKLSAIPLVIVGIFLLLQTLKQKKFRLAGSLVLISILATLPFLLRNLISSGYLFYPSPILNLFSVDWKLDPQIVKEQVQYIKAYAKTVGAFNGRTTTEVVNLPLYEWITSWWKLISLSDKVVLSLIVVSILLGLTRIGRIVKSDLPVKVSLLTVAMGMIFWFQLAPDPRFGWSFLMPTPILIAISAFPNIRLNQGQSRLANSLLFIFISITVSFSVYRFAKFFKPQQILVPLGAKQIPFTTIHCGTETFSLPMDKKSCGDADLPCSEDSCNKIKFRGTSITSGFTAQ